MFFIRKSTETKKVKAKASWYQLGQKCGEGGQEQTIYKITRFKNIQTSGSRCLGFLIVQKGDKERAANLTKTRKITCQESWLGCLHTANLTLLNSSLRPQGWRGLKSLCDTNGLGSPQSSCFHPARPGHRIHTTFRASTPGDFPAPSSWSLYAHLARPSPQTFGFHVLTASASPLAPTTLNRWSWSLHLPQQLCCDDWLVIMCKVLRTGLAHSKGYVGFSLLFL